jgi:hypothetical protein
MATAVIPRTYNLIGFKPGPAKIHGPTLVLDTLASGGWNRKHDLRPKGQATMLRLLNSRRGKFLIVVYHVKNGANPRTPWRVACTNEKGTSGLTSNCSPMTIHKELVMQGTSMPVDQAGHFMEFKSQKDAMSWADAQTW